MDLAKLSNICRRIDVIDDKKVAPEDKNFYAVNMHGYEMPEDYVIPNNVRVIMFCYTGRILNICPRFDKFNWEKIFTNEDAVYNYCTFLATISSYSTLRNHFCVYSPGDTIKNIEFKIDDYFRHGVFSLPVHASVMDWDANKVYATSQKAVDHTMTERPESLQMDRTTNISINRKKASELLKDLENPANFVSRWKMPIRTTLASIVKQIKFRDQGCTLLLLTCREGKPQKLKHAPRVVQELQQMINKLST